MSNKVFGRCAPKHLERNLNFKKMQHLNLTKYHINNNWEEVM